jgi:SnoaL-like domain
MRINRLAFRTFARAAIASLLLLLPLESWASEADPDAKRYGDYQKIVAVLKQYLVALDSMDADLYASAFAEKDAVFTIRDVTRLGREQIRLEVAGEPAPAAAANTSAQPIAKPVTWHMMSSSRIEFTGGRTARHHAYYQVWTRLNEHPGGIVRLTSPITMVAIGRYDDELVKVGSSWYIKTRKITPDTTGGF